MELLKHEPLVSIVTVVYNCRVGIEVTIKSVINQSYKNIEYIIIDGGSTDGTVDVIKNYENNIACWISEKDKGISDAFNKGILRCNGEIIGLINADDWYELDTIQIVVDNFSYGEVIHGNMQSWLNGKKEFVYTANSKLLNREMTINHMAAFVKKEIYEKFGLFKENYRFAMDYEIMLRFYKKEVNFFYIDSVLVNMTLGGVSYINWKKAIGEAVPSKIENGISPIWAYSYYFYHITRSAISNWLKKGSGEWILKLYRSFFSIQKKVKI